MKKRMNKKMRVKLEKYQDNAEYYGFRIDQRHLGVVRCPVCKLPLVSGFTDLTGDYYVCKSCAKVVPVNSKKANEG